jgi:hypothetical protein
MKTPKKTRKQVNCGECNVIYDKYPCFLVFLKYFFFFLNATIILQNTAASLIIQCKLNDVIIVPKSISFNSILYQHTQKDKKFVLKANKKK